MLKEATLWAKMGDNDKAKDLLEKIADERKKSEPETPRKTGRSSAANNFNADASSSSDSD